MSSEVTATVSEPSGDTAAEPKFWATYTIGGREIHFNRPTPEQFMVLRRLATQLDDSETNARRVTAMAKILDAVSACMASDAEVDFVDNLVLARKVGMEELAPMIQACLSGPNADKPEAPKNGPAKRVRRR